MRDHAPPRPALDRRGEKVSATVAREIVRDIAHRDLRPGATLEPESAMLARYGVARASLREALRVLETHGLVRMKPGPGGGPVVSDVDSREFGRMMTLFLQVRGIRFGELVEARLIVEPVAARLAAARHAPEDEEELRRIVELSGTADDDPSWLRASDDFHGKVMSMSGNGLVDLFARAMKDISTDRASAVYLPRRRGHVRRAHAAIADAIIAGDAEVAERLMHEHMAEYARTVARREPQLIGEVVDWR